jgi:tetratricopeptide (TPR) repeat protein
MDTSEQILRQLRWIKWLNALIAICFATTAGSFVWVSLKMPRTTSNAAYSASFTNQGTNLLNEGKAKEVILLAEEREKKFPMDPYVYWYRGRAYYQLGEYGAALKAILFADELCPAWHDDYTGPFIKRIKDKLAERDSSSALHLPSGSSNASTRTAHTGR